MQPWVALHLRILGNVLVAMLCVWHSGWRVPVPARLRDSSSRMQTYVELFNTAPTPPVPRPTRRRGRSGCPSYFKVLEKYKGGPVRPEAEASPDQVFALKARVDLDLSPCADFSLCANFQHRFVQSLQVPAHLNYDAWLSLCGMFSRMSAHVRGEKGLARGGQLQRLRAAQLVHDTIGRHLVKDCLGSPCMGRRTEGPVPPVSPGAPFAGPLLNRRDGDPARLRSDAKPEGRSVTSLRSRQRLLLKSRRRVGGSSP